MAQRLHRYFSRSKKRLTTPEARAHRGGSDDATNVIKHSAGTYDADMEGGDRNMRIMR